MRYSLIFILSLFTIVLIQVLINSLYYIVHTQQQNHLFHMVYFLTSSRNPNLNLVQWAYNIDSNSKDQATPVLVLPVSWTRMGRWMHKYIYELSMFPTNGGTMTFPYSLVLLPHPLILKLCWKTLFYNTDWTNVMYPWCTPLGWNYHYLQTFYSLCLPLSVSLCFPCPSFILQHSFFLVHYRKV